MRKQEFGKKYLILDLQAYSQFLPPPTFYLEALRVIHASLRHSMNCGKGDFLDGVVKGLFLCVLKLIGCSVAKRSLFNLLWHFLLHIDRFLRYTTATCVTS